MIHQTNRLDKSRKLLIKELNNNILKQAQLFPKRLPQNSTDYQMLDAVKKKNHLDKANAIGLVYSEDKKVIQKEITSHEIFLKIQKNLQKNKQFNKKVQELNLKNTIDNQKNDNANLIKQPFDLKFENKMLDFGLNTLQQTNVLSQKQKLLVTIQQKLDDYLSFLKQYRKKKKGELFGIIKKHFLQNYGIFLEFSHIKQINFLCKNHYSISPTGAGVDINCLINIQKQNQQPSSAEENKDTQFLSAKFFKQRKQMFKQKIQEYVLFNKSPQNQQTFQIPELYYDFQKKWTDDKNNLKKNVKDLFHGQLLPKKIDKFFVLQQKNSKLYQQSKKLLTKGIQKVQKLIQKQTLLDATLLSKKMTVQRRLAQKQIQNMIQQIKFIYFNKNVTNILRILLLQNLSKKIILSQQIIQKSLTLLIKYASKINSSNPLLKQINHKNGILIQFDKSSLDEFNKKFYSEEEYLQQFNFDTELNQKQKQKILEKERQEVLKQDDQEKNNKEKYVHLLDQVKQQKRNKMKEHKILEQAKKLKIIKQKEQKKIKIKLQDMERSSSSDSKSSISSQGSQARRKQFQMEQKLKKNGIKKVQSDNEDQFCSPPQNNKTSQIKQQFRSTLQNTQQKIEVYHSESQDQVQTKKNKQIKAKNNKNNRVKSQKKSDKISKQQKDSKSKITTEIKQKQEKQNKKTENKSKIQQIDLEEQDENVEWGKKYKSKKKKQQGQNPKKEKVRLVRQRW